MKTTYLSDTQTTMEANKIDTYLEAYELLLSGKAVYEPTAPDGRVETNIKQVRWAHPCLELECVGSIGDCNVYAAKPECLAAIADPARYYEGEELPKGVEHFLKVNGREVCRDSYYITEKVRRSEVRPAMDNVFEIAERLKLYPHIAGLDIYYGDGRHVQLCAHDDIPCGRDTIAGRCKALSFKLRLDRLTWWHKGEEMKVVPYEGVTLVRAHYFGKMIMT